MSFWTYDANIIDKKRNWERLVYYASISFPSWLLQLETNKVDEEKMIKLAVDLEFYRKREEILKEDNSRLLKKLNEVEEKLRKTEESVSFI